MNEPRISTQSTANALRYTQEIRVPFAYDVVFTRDVFAPTQTLLRDALPAQADGHARCLVYLDAGLADAQPALRERIAAHFAAQSDHLELVGPVRTIAGGEQAKNGWRRVQEIMDACREHRMCRHSYVIAIGGGAMLDMVGFAASIVHRGLRMVRMPSTVLAQNDAGVGVKTGMNEYGNKNFAGTFSPPHIVINDFDLLDSLPFPHWTGGIAEAFKVAMIRDEQFFAELCGMSTQLRRRDRASMEHVVRRCAELHLDHIRMHGDPFESGTARPLDFGHWSAHRLEVMSDYTLSHGQAVSIGIALDSYYAMRAGLLNVGAVETTAAALNACGLPTYHYLLEVRDSSGRLMILDGLDQFREHLGGTLTLTLPDGIGKMTEIHEVDANIIEDGIGWLHLRQEDGATADGVIDFETPDED